MGTEIISFIHVALLLIKQLSRVSIVCWPRISSYRSPSFLDFIFNEMLVLLRQTIDRQLVGSNQAQYCTGSDEMTNDVESIRGL